MLQSLFLLLTVAGMPIAIAMSAAALIYIMISGNLPPFVVIHRMISGIDSFPLLAVPFFILAGNLMNNAGITNRIFDIAMALVGWLKGGLGHVNVVASIIFSGMSGTAIADAAGLGTIEVKAMKDRGYSAEFAVGVTAASATLGPIIPPSLPIVIYAMLANVSVGGMFLAGIVPGIMIALLLMAMVTYYAWKNGWGGDEKFVSSRFVRGLLEVAIVIGWPLGLWLLVQAGAPPRTTVFIGLALLFLADWKFRFTAVLPMMTPILLIGGMTVGLFTPTEGAIAACIWAMVLGMFWYRTLNLKRTLKICLDTVETTSVVMFIVAASSIFSWMLTAEGITADVASWILGVTDEQWQFLLLANLLMLFVGLFLEPVAAITILVPILLPVVLQLGIDPMHFGLVMVLNLMIGLITPPVGLVLFIMARIGEMTLERTLVALLPWFVPLVASLIIITYVPAVTLWLPRLLQ
ncbi:MAG: TRAP transporter large permease [Hydrogenophaga sp.]|nr:TRAP transporter large permease [Hydrogenophaga sp.]